MTWGTGQNRDRIRPGDRLFLLRQGNRGRGIVATGRAADFIQRDPRFDPSSRSGNFVEVEWKLVLPLEDLLPTEELLIRVPGVPWKHIFSSGFTVPAASAGVLLSVWEEHVSSLDG